MGTSDRGVIFPSGDAYYSEPFDLIKDLGMVSIIGLQDGDIAHVEIFIGDSCHGEWVPFSTSCCGQMGINAPVNQMFLVVPNKYRLVFSNETGQHLTDPSWFENVKAFYKIVESDLDLSNLAKGDCDMVCRQTTAASSAQADFDGIKIGTHTSGDGAVTEFDIPVIKRNGESVPITIDPDTGKACINIIDENTETPELFITGAEIVDDTITLTRSDGATFPIEITHPAIPDAETEQNNINADVEPVVNLTRQIIQFSTIEDVSGETGTLNVDISSLISALTSTPHPAIIAGDNITITGNDVDGYTINSTDPTVDTDTFGTAVANPDGTTTVTFPDGTSYTSAVTSTPHPAIIAGDNITITGNDVDGYTISSTDPTVDTDTFGTAVTNPDGTVTITFPDGTSYTSSVSTTTTVTDGGSKIVDDTDPLNPVIRPLLRACDDSVFDFVNDRLHEMGADSISFSAQEGQVTVDDAQLADIAANGSQVVQTIRETITNNDPDGCDWIVKGTYYCQTDVRLAEDNRITLNFGAGAGSDPATALSGAPFLIYDERFRNAGNRTVAYSPVFRHAIGRIPFGTTVTISEDVSVTMGNYNPNASNRVRLQNPRLQYVIVRRGKDLL